MLAALATAFHHTLDPAASELWFGSCLERIDREVGERTVRRLVADDQRWPTPARFNEVRRAVDAGLPPDRQLPSAAADPARNLAAVRKAREVLRDARAR